MNTSFMSAGAPVTVVRTKSAGGGDNKDSIKDYQAHARLVRNGEEPTGGIEKILKLSREVDVKCINYKNNEQSIVHKK